MISTRIMSTRMGRLALPLLGALALLFLLGDVLAAPETSAAQPPDFNPLSRSRDPIVLTGASLGAFQGTELGDLYAYAYDGSTWQQIPFQWDEVEPISNTFVISEDGLLDANDQLAFLAQDAGQQAPLGQWIDDHQSTAFARYELAVSDPLFPGEQAWVYLYRSPELTATFGPGYLQVTSETITTPFFAASIDLSQTLGLTSLSLNGQTANILDRSHVSIKGLFLVFPVQQCEEDLVALITDTTTLVGSLLPATSQPVRFVSGAVGGQGAAVYPASLRLSLGTIDLDALAAGISIPGVTLQELRFSILDLLNPSDSGYGPARFFSQQLAATGVTIDGSPDAVPTTLASWTQYNGNQGSVILLNDVQATGTTVFSYYLDDSNATASDCHGDDGAYGESGLRITPFSGQVSLVQELIFSEPLTQALGATYQAYAANPLQVLTHTQYTCFFADVDPNADHGNPALCDGDVDVVDVQRVAGCWDQSAGSATCPEGLDLDDSGLIDILDIEAVAHQWGWTVQALN